MAGIKGRVIQLQPDWLILVLRHWKTHREFPNLISPRTFNEKVLHRILFDRRELLTQVTDKFAMRSYVEPCLGAQILPKLYCVTTDPDTIPFDQLPEKFVVKATHGSGWVKIVMDKASLDRPALIITCHGWLRQNYYHNWREWAYKPIEPRIILEQFIDDGTGAIPNDYKLFVFGGTVEMIQVDANRFTGHRRRLYSPAWEKLPVLLKHDDISGNIAKPVHLGEMIAAAETLGRDLDFIRADFYDTPGRLYLGELTATPGCGLERFRPKEFDRYLGRRWKLPA
jgi:hypothetical protein